MEVGSSTAFEYWDAVHDALEGYRTATEVTFTGKVVTWKADKLSAVLGSMLVRMDHGAKRALAFSQLHGKPVSILDGYTGGGVSPTYFKFVVDKYELTGKTSSRGLPTVKVSNLRPEVLPLFLEGPTRQLKTLTSAEDQLGVYEAVRQSELKDVELDMYKISGPLTSMAFEVGRMKAFDSGWLENESVWLHMSYKWYLELLRAGLYAQFFSEIKKGVVAFMDPAVLGRSPLEATSFIVSSAFPDKSLHGSGFLARLSGSTAEFLSMWNHMMVGATPFSIAPKTKELQLTLSPAISSWLWREDGTLTFKFLGTIEVTYVMTAKKNSWEAAISSYDLHGPDGTVHVDGASVPSPLAGEVRNLKYSSITVTLA